MGVQYLRIKLKHFQKYKNRGLIAEELNRCAVDFPYLPFFGQNTFPILFNRDISSLVDRVESQYNFLCHTVGMSWRKSKSKEVV